MFVGYMELDKCISVLAPHCLRALRAVYGLEDVLSYVTLFDKEIFTQTHVSMRACLRGLSFGELEQRIPPGEVSMHPATLRRSIPATNHIYCKRMTHNQ